MITDKDKRKKKKMVRLKDIADELGLSLSVVSRVLSPAPDKHAVIADKTREKVLQVAERMGYKRNRIAEFLSKGKSAAIGVFLPDISNDLIARLIMGMSDVASVNGFPLKFFFGLNEQDYRRFIENSTENSLSGIITYPHPIMSNDMIRDEIETYLKNNGKVVFIRHYLFDVKLPDVPVVGIDDYYGGALAAERLIRKGCDKFVNCYDAGLRTRGFIETLRKKNRKCEIVNPENMERWIRDYFRRNDTGTPGIFASFDEYALDIMRILVEVGRIPGKDACIVGYDDLFLTDKAVYPLTTIHQPFRELGSLSVEKVIKLIYNGNEQSENIKPYLVERCSG